MKKALIRIDWFSCSFSSLSVTDKANGWVKTWISALSSAQFSSVAWSCPTLCDPMNYIPHQVPLSMGFSRQEYQSGLPFTSLRDLPDPGFKLMSLTSPALASRFFTTSATWEVLVPSSYNLLLGQLIAKCLLSSADGVILFAWLWLGTAQVSTTENMKTLWNFSI